MTAYFQYRNNYSIVTKCKYGSPVIVYVTDGIVEGINLDDVEYNATDDRLNDAAVLVQDGSQPYQWVSLADLCRYAADEYPAIMAEVQREADNEARHQKSMSDSGRFI